MTRKELHMASALEGDWAEGPLEGTVWQEGTV